MSEREAPPPGTAEKLERQVTNPGRSRRTLASLRLSRGYEVLDQTGKLPDRVRICPMDSVTVWRRTDSGTGDGTFFELSEDQNFLP